MKTTPNPKATKKSNGELVGPPPPPEGFEVVADGASTVVEGGDVDVGVGWLVEVA